jgi:3-hydroxypropanoate dehydrogenase
MQVIAEESLDRLFRTARSSGEWSDEPVPTSTLRDIYDLSKWGPSSMNTSPARYVFIMSGEAKERLSPHLAPMNRAKALGAPVCAIVGYDLAFDAYLPTLFPHRPDAASLFADPELRATTAFRNGSLQGAISSWPRARLDLIAARCQASTMPASTKSSSPAPT